MGRTSILSIYLNPVDTKNRMKRYPIILRSVALAAAALLTLVACQTTRSLDDRFPLSADGDFDDPADLRELS
ncbi:MAG: ABC-type uncharacterized transport system auxiliary subunit, partial [Pirellulaceae bacterium]